MTTATKPTTPDVSLLSAYELGIYAVASGLPTDPDCYFPKHELMIRREFREGVQNAETLKRLAEELRARKNLSREVLLEYNVPIDPKSEGDETFAPFSPAPPFERGLVLSLTAAWLLLVWMFASLA